MTTFEDIQVGDPVYRINSSAFRPDWEPVNVERLTKTLIITSDKGRFRRRGGWEVGVDWGGAHLVSRTPETNARFLQWQKTGGLKYRRRAMGRAVERWLRTATSEQLGSLAKLMEDE